MPSRLRATSSRIAKARPSDCTRTRWRSAASSSILTDNGRGGGAGIGVGDAIGLRRALVLVEVRIDRGSQWAAARSIIEQNDAPFGHGADRITIIPLSG